MKVIIDKLFELQDLEYREFQSRLVPDFPKDKIIGVRNPNLRKLTKELLKEYDLKDFINEKHEYYEEKNIHALVLENEKDLESWKLNLEKFLPHIDNWATCDLASCNVIKKYPKEAYPIILDCLDSEEPYIKRFGIVNLLKFYLDDNFTIESMRKVCNIKSEDYYVNMAIAWYVSYAIIKQYDLAIKYLEENKFAKFVHNKSIQKSIESFRVPKERKEYLKTLRING